MIPLIPGEVLVSPEVGSFALRTDRHVLGGTVSVDGIETGLKRVAIFHRHTLSLVAITRSKADGSWQLTGIPQYTAGDLFVVALDDTGTKNAEIADYVSQVTS